MGIKDESGAKQRTNFVMLAKIPLGFEGSRRPFANVGGRVVIITML